VHPDGLGQNALGIGGQPPARDRHALVSARSTFAVAALCSLACSSAKSGTANADASVGGPCATTGPSACGPGLVCERGTAGCADPNWAEWRMPNAQVEVTAGAPNLENYTDNGDGTVTDNVTGLMWQQLTPSANYDQAQALMYCAELTLGAHSDWRLPSVIELVSIVDTGTYNPSIDSDFFPATPAVGFYWSVTPYAGQTANAWGVYFNNGYSASVDTSTPYSVRCVR